ncbi:MFS transporter [Companilactobacillus musae]|uniref:MFS transporter n=1 Tax=Companilactobacillus musae TaxID=1903258 RepID=UPI000E65833F|nr:MFS transporter [Companilactobacillus musae]
MEQNKLNRTFIFSVLGLILIFSASASPIPTYARLQKALNITTNTISMTAVCYFVGCILALLVFSRVSDYIGRKKVSIATLILSILGLILLMNTNNGSTLLVARAVQGFSCGLGSSTLSVLIIESGINKNSNLVSAITGSAVLLGLALGGLLSGIIGQFLPNIKNLTYLIILIALVITSLGLFTSIETTNLKDGVLNSLRPKLDLPKGIVQTLIPAAGCFIATWAFGGYFQAFSATVSENIFKINSPLVAAIILVAYMAPNFIGSNISNKFSARRGQLIGILGFMISIIAMGLGIIMHNFIFYIVVVIAASIMQGIAYTSAMNNLLSKTIKEKSTGLLSVIYILSYMGAGIPSFIAGKLSGTFNFSQITLGYIIFANVVGLIVIISLYFSHSNTKEMNKNS